MKLFLLFTVWALSSAHEISQLQVPLYADPRRAAELSCHFHMDGQRLHSVKWYRDMHEIFRYIPSQKTPIRLYNVTDIMVVGGECQEEWCTVVVMPPPVATRAAYTCEVSTEGPRFQIARQTKHMTVVALPVSDPVIAGAAARARPGDQLLLNCTSDYSLPPAEISWYIDDVLQKPEAWQRTETSSAAAGGLRASWRTLLVHTSSGAEGTDLRTRCEATLRVEPPVVRSATATIELSQNARTQLSKYTASGGDSISTQTTNFYLLIWTVTLVLAVSYL